MLKPFVPMMPPAGNVTVIGTPGVKGSDGVNVTTEPRTLNVPVLEGLRTKVVEVTVDAMIC